METNMPSDIRATAAPGPTITSSGTNSDESRLIPCKALKGEAVLGPSGETLGVIDDAILEPETGRVVYIALHLDGAAGVDAGPSPIPFARLQYDHARRGYITDLSREQIDSAPHHPENWHEDRLWHLHAHKHYGVSTG